MTEVNLDIYCGVLLVISMMASAGLAARIAYFLGKRWNQNEATVNCMMVAGCFCAAGASYHISIALALAGGSMFAFGGILLCPLVTAASWLYLIGGIRTAERILTGLENKLSV